MNDKNKLDGQLTELGGNTGVEGTPQADIYFPSLALLIEIGRDTVFNVSALQGVFEIGIQHHYNEEGEKLNEITSRTACHKEGEPQKGPQSILVHHVKNSGTPKATKGSTALVVKKMKPTTPERIRAQAARLYDEIHHLIDQYNLRKQRERYFKAGRRPLGTCDLQEALELPRRPSNAEYQQSSSRRAGDSSRNSFVSRNEKDEDISPKILGEAPRLGSRLGQSPLHLPPSRLSTSPRSPRTRDGALPPSSGRGKAKSPFRLPNLKEEFQLSRQKYLEAAEEERNRAFPLEQRKLAGDLQKDPSSFSLRFQITQRYKQQSMIGGEQN